MNLVDKENVTLAQIGENGSQVTGALNGGAGRDTDVDTQLVGDEMGDGRLAQTGRAIEKNMIQCFVPSNGGLDKNTEVLLDALLPDQLGEGLRSEGSVDCNVLAPLLGR